MDSGFRFVPLQLRVSEMTMWDYISEVRLLADPVLTECRYRNDSTVKLSLICSRLELCFNSWSHMHNANKNRIPRFLGLAILFSIHSTHLVMTKNSNEVLLLSGCFTLVWRHSSSLTLLFTRWQDAKSLEDINPPRPRLLLQGSDTMWFRANQMKCTAIISHKAIPSHHHDNLADHVNCHASELIRIMC